jgi:hypothetical protein
LIEECCKGNLPAGRIQISQSTSILNWETSLVNDYDRENGLKLKSDFFKKLSSSFSATDFPTRTKGDKFIHSVSSLRIKETSFITINNFNNNTINSNNSSSKNGKIKFEQDDVIKEASRIEI